MRKGLTNSEAGKLGAIQSAKIIALKKQQRIESWIKSPKLCLYCHSPIEYSKRRNDFCTQSCGAKYQNIKMGFDPAEILDACLSCKLPLIEKGQHKFCSKDCEYHFKWSQKKLELITIGADLSAANRVGKKYLIELHNGKCQLCKLSSWNDKPMPLVLDHISGNPYDNSLTNIRVICHNCNAQTPTFTGRNKGNGRIERAKRYILEKDIVKQMKASLG